MTPDELQDFRVERLKQLLEQKFGGVKIDLARALGHKTGAFVRQLIDRERPVTEKTVTAIEALPGCKDWFARRVALFKPATGEPSLTFPASGIVDFLQATTAEVDASLGELGPDIVIRSNHNAKQMMLVEVKRFAGLARSGMPAPRLKLLAQMVASMFEEGPTETTTKAIDAYTSELDAMAEDRAAEAARMQPSLDAAFRDRFYAIKDEWASRLAMTDRELLDNFAAAIEAEALRAVNATAKSSTKAFGQKAPL